MGFLISQTPEMGEYHVEARSESFVIGGSSTHCWKNARTGEINTDEADPGAGWVFSKYEPRHAFFVYTYPKERQGTVEGLIEDIPKIRACLDAVEAYVRERGY